MLWKIYKRILKFIAKRIPIFQLRVFFFRLAGYRIGKKVYIGEDLIIIDGLEDKGKVIIGDRVAIAERVTLVISSNPNFSRIRTYAPIANGPIIIEQDAWLGTGAIVMPDVTIGEGAIVGAGSVVTEDVPPFTIVAGSPAKFIRMLSIPERNKV